MKLKPEFVATVKAALAQNPKSMAEAARLAKMHFGTFKRYAQALGLYDTNQAGEGVSKPAKDLIPLDEILAGLHPTYGTNALKKAPASKRYF